MATIIVRGFTDKERDSINTFAADKGKSTNKVARNAILKAAGLPADDQGKKTRKK